MPNTIYEFWLMVQQNITKSIAAANSINQKPAINMDSNHFIKTKSSSIVGSQKIAMLTDIIENSRQKCAIYFPQNLNETMAFSNTGNVSDNIAIAQTYIDEIFSKLNNCNTIEFAMDNIDDKQFFQHLLQSTIKCNYILIKNIEISVKNGYTIRKLVLVYLNGKQLSVTKKLSQFIVYHYWFPDWPDHRSPNDIDVLLDMSLDLLDIDKPPINDNDNSSKSDFKCNITNDLTIMPIIHCSAGIGRTGCLAAILNGLRQMRTTLMTSSATLSSEETCCDLSTSGMTVDVLGIVCNLRLQRGGMVQNSEQYELIHRALCLYQRRLIQQQPKHQPLPQNIDKQQDDGQHQSK